MREEWQEERLGDICEFVRGPFGGSLKKSCFVSDGYAVYEQQHAINNQFDHIRYFVDTAKFKEMQRFELHPNDLIMSCSGTMGKVAIAPPELKPGIINQALLKLTPSDKLNVEFLNSWMESPNFQNQLAAETTGVAIKNVASVKVLKEIKIELPSIPEQKRIVTILDETFEGIDSAIANTQENLANARGIFDSYLNNVFTKKGEGWVDSTLSEMCSERITDGTHQTPKYFDSGYIFLSSKNVTSRSIDWENVKYIDEKQHFDMQRRISPKRGDILLAKNGTTGVAAIVDKDEIFDIYVSLAWLRPAKNISSRFMWHFVNSPVAKKQFNKRLKGVGVPNLHLKEIREVVISYPKSLDVQNAVAKQLDDLESIVHSLEIIYQQKLDYLNELKQSLLAKAFSGELTTQPEQILKEAVG